MQGSVEALLGELGKIQHSEVRVNVIHTGVGGITENDINLASASNALVIGFNVRPSAEARALADREGVDIRTYRVIYQLTDEIQQALVGMLSPVQTEETIGEAEVRALFKVSRLGTIAGCMVTTGTIRRNAQVRVVRDGTEIYDTSIAQLKRFKDDAREVTEGFECGILLDGYNDLKEGDILEAYETKQVERTDLAEAARVPAAEPAEASAGDAERRRRVTLQAVPALSRYRRLERPLQYHRGDGLHRHLHVRDPHSGEPLAEGEAHGAAFGQGAALESHLVLDCRGRSPRRLATIAADARVRRA